MQVYFKEKDNNLISDVNYCNFPFILRGLHQLYVHKERTLIDMKLIHVLDYIEHLWHIRK